VSDVSAGAPKPAPINKRPAPLEPRNRVGSKFGQAGSRRVGRKQPGKTKTSKKQALWLLAPIIVFVGVLAFMVLFKDFLGLGERQILLPEHWPATAKEAVIHYGDLHPGSAPLP
jgi:hypothetical protein